MDLAQPMPARAPLARRRPASLVALALAPLLAPLLTLGACKGPVAAPAPAPAADHPPATTLAPLGARWRETKVVQADAELTFPSAYGDSKIKFELQGFDYVVTCDKCGFDIAATAFGKPLVRVGEGDAYALRQDVRASLASLPVEGAFPAQGVKAARVKPAGTLELRVPRSEPFVAELPEVGVSALAAAFVAIERGPISFGPDDTRPPASHSVLAGARAVIGPAATVQDIDWIAVEKLPSRRETGKTCRYREGTAALVLQDTEVVVYERRTGKELARKLFQAQADCPRDGWSNEGRIAALAATGAIDAWLHGQLGR